MRSSPVVRNKSLRALPGVRSGQAGTCSRSCRCLRLWNESLLLDLHHPAGEFRHTICTLGSALHCMLNDLSPMSSWDRTRYRTNYWPFFASVTRDLVEVDTRYDCIISCKSHLSDLSTAVSILGHEVHPGNAFPLVYLPPFVSLFARQPSHHVASLL